jgi:hypothetical protein
MRFKLKEFNKLYTWYAWYPVDLQDKKCIAVFEKVQYEYVPSRGVLYYSSEYKRKQPKPPNPGVC